MAQMTKLEEVAMNISVLVVLSLLPLSAFMLHSAACSMHVEAVDRMRNQSMRTSYQGLFYRYCRVVGTPARKLFP
jgi:hypothetical protein